MRSTLCGLYVFLAAYLSVLVSLGLAAPAESSGGRWHTVTPAPTKRTEVCAAAVGGTIYVVGGFSEPTLGNLKDLAISRVVEAYDPAGDRWMPKAPLPIGLHHAGIGVVDGRLFVIGGFTQSILSVWRPVATVYEYDSAKDAWAERAPMPTARGALAVAEIGGKLMAIGGYDGERNSPMVEEYDPGADRWRARAPLPTPRDHLAAATIGSRVYAIGGRLNRDYSRNLGVTEIYNASVDRWTKAADLPTPRSGITAGVIDGVIYVVGGEGPDGTFQTNEAYDPGSDRWWMVAPMPTGRHGLGSAVIGGRLYVLSGGPRPGGSFSNVVEVYEPPPSAGVPGARASAAQVGTVMALLAAFQDADVLPPESSPEANRLIKALIQFQAAFMKSRHPAVTRWLREAVTMQGGSEAAAEVERFRARGWTARSLEAVVDYAEGRALWDNAGMDEGFRAYHVGRDDFELLARTVRAARAGLAARGDTLHGTYAARRREMPGAKQER